MSLDRANNACELCSSQKDLRVQPVSPHDDHNPDHNIQVCGACAKELGATELSDTHWFCLQESAWSQEPAVQVTAYRLLSRLQESWAKDLLEQLYMEDDVLAWARSGQDAEDTEPTLDSNGAVLKDGDSVTLIKDLNVKGGGFTAKRGTLVKNIRLTDNPKHIEGRVNKTTIVLVTAFLKKA